MHTTDNHKWEATDTPGVCVCSCNAERMFNRFTKEYEVYNV